MLQWKEMLWWLIFEIPKTFERFIYSLYFTCKWKHLLLTKFLANRYFKAIHFELLWNLAVSFQSHSSSSKLHSICEIGYLLLPVLTDSLPWPVSCCLIFLPLAYILNFLVSPSYYYKSYLYKTSAWSVISPVKMFQDFVMTVGEKIHLNSFVVQHSRRF